MFPHTPDEEYVIEIWRGEVLKMFQVVRVKIQLFPSYLLFELWIDANLVYTYKQERQYLL